MTDSPPTDRIAQLSARLASRTPTARTLVSLTLVAGLALSVAVAAPATAQSDGGTFQLATDSVTSTTNATISGTTTLEPGTELQVRVQSTGETDPQFLKTSAATVGDDGSWTTTFDLSAVETHDTITVTVVGPDGDPTADFDASVRNDRATPSETGSSTSTPGFGVVVAAAGILGSLLVLRRRRRR
ncbi:PGF-CTERM sorting domain-containing protein [Halobellus sp. Atlit-31R]|nr:PGF-CTERM sorting domain-containing protein [Halobellus sp. Atlit-31R]